MFRYKEINRVAKFSMAAVTVITLFSYLVITPKFTEYVYRNTTDDLIAVANHVASSLALGEALSLGRPIPDNLFVELEKFRNNATPLKIKVFTPAGAVIYSTISEEVGDTREADKIRGVILGGIGVGKLEVGVKGKGRQAVVEVYVPMSVADAPVGVLEVYYDITGRWKRLHYLTAFSHAFLLAVFLFLFGTLFAVSRKALANIREKEDVENSNWRLKEELAHARQKEYLSTLTRGVAHDFNNILTAVMGNIKLLKKLQARGESDVELLNQMDRATHEARDLISHLALISRAESLKKETIQLASLIGRSVPVDDDKARVRMVMMLGDDLRPIIGDANFLAKAITALILNADQAMEGGGVVNVMAVNAKVSAGNEEGIPPGTYVKISIKDSGKGIPPEDLERVFDPYFTTRSRDSQRGTGLGLAFCKSIIDNHDGFIRIQSTVGRGTTVKIFLPVE
ncbi:MAG: hypothetical protein KKG47_08960 [Proteobacteria bacterium]|nr:hypothetical protein [Pseudomonadota bacterium]MBU1739004.1 hypothetical protein [Pseudomonadota bacterium]